MVALMWTVWFISIISSFQLKMIVLQNAFETNQMIELKELTLYYVEKLTVVSNLCLIWVLSDRRRYLSCYGRCCGEIRHPSNIPVREIQRQPELQIRYLPIVFLAFMFQLSCNVTTHSVEVGNCRVLTVAKRHLWPSMFTAIFNLVAHLRLA